MMGLCIFVLSYMASLSPHALSIVNPVKTTQTGFCTPWRGKEKLFWQSFYFKKKGKLFVRAACLQLKKHDRALRIKGRICQDIQRASDSSGRSDNKFQTCITGAKFLVNRLAAQYCLTVKLVKPESYRTARPTIYRAGKSEVQDRPGLKNNLQNFGEKQEGHRNSLKQCQWQKKEKKKWSAWTYCRYSGPGRLTRHRWNWGGGMSSKQVWEG